MLVRPTNRPGNEATLDTSWRISDADSAVHPAVRKEGGAWERIIINAPQAIDRGEGQGTAEVNGAGPSAMMVEKDVVGPSAMVVESGGVGPSPMVTEVGRYAQSSRRMDS